MTLNKKLSRIVAIHHQPTASDEFMTLKQVPDVGDLYRQPVSPSFLHFSKLFSLFDHMIGPQQVLPQPFVAGLIVFCIFFTCILF